MLTGFSQLGAETVSYLGSTDLLLAQPTLEPHSKPLHLSPEPSALPPLGTVTVSSCVNRYRAEELLDSEAAMRQEEPLPSLDLSSQSSHL